MNIFKNPFLGTGIKDLDSNIPFPSTDVEKPADLLKRCPVFAPTPLRNSSALAQECAVAGLYVKDERDRFGLGSFKALGAAYVIACDAEKTGSSQQNNCLAGVTYVTASAGNHGLSVASGALVFGAKAVVYIAETVPESFARRLRDKNAIVIRHGTDYQQSMEGAVAAASDNNWRLLSDTSWPGYFDVPYRLMEGYLQLVQETIEQIPQPPDHIFLQAGVGGFAGAVTGLVRQKWHDHPKIIIVEPAAAPALQYSIKAGRPIIADGPVSSMGRLDCKEPSLIALKGLARDANYFITVSDREVESILPLLARCNLATTASGAAGIAGLMMAKTCQNDLRLSAQSHVLTFITEGP